MKITGHQTAHVFKHYDLGDVDALRDRLTRARAQVGTLRTQRRRETIGEQRVTR